MEPNNEHGIPPAEVETVLSLRIIESLLLKIAALTSVLVLAASFTDQDQDGNKISHKEFLDKNLKALGLDSAITSSISGRSEVTMPVILETQVTDNEETESSDRPSQSTMIQRREVSHVTIVSPTVASRDQSPKRQVAEEVGIGIDIDEHTNTVGQSPQPKQKDHCKIFKVNEIVLAITGQAAASVLCNALTTSSTSSALGFFRQFIVAAIPVGFSCSLVAISLRGIKPRAAGIVSKVGVITTACVILVGMGLVYLPEINTWIGGVAALITSIAILFS